MQRVYQIVGIDEANPKLGKISWISPLAKQLLGREVGDTIKLQAPTGVTGFEVLATNHF